MNKIVLLGRLVRDPELRTVESSGKVYTKFTIAVKREYKSSDGERKSDFIPLIMWEKKAEIACEYLKKGDTITLSGRVITKNYEDNEGKRRYFIEVSVDEFRKINMNKKLEEKREV
ncbi:single-stranded DNA-binding protein [Clostridium mediterraneense]|uniref:single-stranded DNA-binding protein n=1 Tax=Clostridium mediterraneense TaxID=1805472 RepID=UPI00082F9B12|nr:single-stranded DNA-binding protein [Clostridium mediterraneense]